MINALSKMTAALLAVALLYMYPAMQAAQRQEDIDTLTAYNSLVQFVDAIRNKGYLSPSMYEEFAQQISLTGGVYDIELEHKHKKYHPEYDDPKDETSFKGEFTIVYDSYFTSDLLRVLYPEPLYTAEGSPEAIFRKYKFETGDYIIISLKQHSKSSYDILSSLMYGSMDGRDPKGLTYGGMVLNEDY